MKDPDGEDQGSKFTAEDGGEIRSSLLLQKSAAEPEAPPVYGWQTNIITHSLTPQCSKLDVSVWIYVFPDFVPPISSASKSTPINVPSAGKIFSNNNNNNNI